MLDIQLAIRHEELRLMQIEEERRYLVLNRRSIEVKNNPNLTMSQRSDGSDVSSQRVNDVTESQRLNDVTADDDSRQRLAHQADVIAPPRRSSTSEGKKHTHFIKSINVIELNRNKTLVSPELTEKHSHKCWVLIDFNVYIYNRWE
jgi:hypothetical protein